MTDSHRLMLAIRELLRVFLVSERQYPTAEGLTRYNPVDFHALHFVADHPGCTSTDLAVALGLKRSSASTLIGRLVRRGLLERGRSASDGRAASLTLTEDGGELRAAIVRQDLRNMETMLEVLGGRDGPELVRLLETLSTRLREAAERS